MDTHSLEIMKANIDKLVRITCLDGEVFVAKILFVSGEEEDVIYDLVSTSQTAGYEKFDKQPAYQILFRDIESVEVIAT